MADKERKVVALTGRDADRVRQYLDMQQFAAAEIAACRERVTAWAQTELDKVRSLHGERIAETWQQMKKDFGLDKGLWHINPFFYDVSGYIYVVPIEPGEQTEVIAEHENHSSSPGYVQGNETKH